MEWVYLSPHLDDAVLSCGGLIWEQVQAGHTVGIWTICAGNPPPGPLSSFAKSLHDRWGTGYSAVARRRAEDIVACQLIGANFRHLSLPDCIYRRSVEDGKHLYTTEESLFGSVHPDEQSLIDNLSLELKRTLPPEVGLICPYGFGGHVDHRLTRATAEQIGVGLWFFADYPYASDHAENLFDSVDNPECKVEIFPISPEGMSVWVQAVAAHASQLSTFWPDLGSMRAAVLTYAQRGGGVHLLRCAPP